MLVLRLRFDRSFYLYTSRGVLVEQTGLVGIEVNNFKQLAYTFF